MAEDKQLFIKFQNEQSIINQAAIQEMAEI